MDENICVVPGCGKPRSARRLCNPHYQRWYATGEYAELAALQPKPASDICSVEECERPRLALGMCNTHYRRVKKHGAGADLTKPSPGAHPAERLLASLQVHPNECWHWTGMTNEQGYGRFKIDGQNILTHRFSYEYFVEPIPEGLDIDHLCHNADLTCSGGKDCLHRRCCNPAHLEPCERGENGLRSKNTIASINAAKVACPANHEYTVVVVDGKAKRFCKTCDRVSRRRRFKERYATDPEFRERIRARAREDQRRRRLAKKAVA